MFSRQNSTKVMSLFTKRSESELGSDFSWASRPGVYLVEVTDAYDSRVVYPEDVDKKKARFIGMTVKIFGIVQMDGESDEDYQDRHDQIDKSASPRIYLSEKAAESSFKLLTEIAGVANLPAAFAKKVTVDDSNPEEPVYDMKALAEHAPVNPGQLIGRRFRAAFDLPEGKGKGLRLDPYKSWLVPEEQQSASVRDLFAGTDTVSAKVRERVVNKRAKGSSRSEGLNQQFDDDDDNALADPVGVGAGKDELPF